MEVLAHREAPPSSSGQEIRTAGTLGRIRRKFSRWLQRRGDNRYCPICDSSAGSFEVFGVPARDDAACPNCDSLERHRMIWLFFQRCTPVCSGASLRFLHIAPEPCLEQRFRRLPGLDYLTADLEDPGAMVKMDVTDIRFPEESFDVILCSHVLEHVPDDRRALGEFFRVLRPGGFAAINVPMHEAPTDEDPSLSDPAERLRRFGQADHFRICGPDYADRIAAAGFQVNPRKSVHLAGDEGCERMGLWEDEQLFHAVKPGNGGGMSAFH